MNETVLWRSGSARLAVVDRELSAEGRTWRQPVVVQGDGVAGAVMVARDGDRLVMVDTCRPLVGARVLELPRGWADPGDETGTPQDWAVAAAVRECAEETGAVVDDARFVGWLWADTGVLASRVGVVAGTVACWAEPTDPAAGTPRRVTREELRAAIAAGRCVDGLTLGALAIVGLPS